MLPPGRPHRLSPTFRLLTVAAVLALVATSCKVDVRLGIRARENGSGEVQARFVLDDDARDVLGGDLEEQLRVADLVQAGWEVDVDENDDGAEIRASRSFATPRELTGVIGQLSGEAGPFRDFRLDRNRSAFRTDFEFTGMVDLEGGVGATTLDPGDEDVASEVEEQGVELEELRAYLSERMDAGFNIEVVAEMPGEGSHNAPSELAGEPRWQPLPGEVIELSASSSELDLDRVVLVAIAAALALASAAFFARWWWSRRTRQGSVTPRP